MPGGKNSRTTKDLQDWFWGGGKGKRVALDVPRNCQQTATFLFDCTKLASRLDYKADDLGRTECVVTVLRDDEGEIIDLSFGKVIHRQKALWRKSVLGANQYLLRKEYYVHKHHRDFKQVVRV